MKKVLFICTHNSARSQIGEALVNSKYSADWQAFSAGVNPGKLNPLVIAALQQCAISTDGLYAKGLEAFQGEKYDLVLTVCDNAKEACPVWLGAGRMIHRSFPDPSTFTGTDNEKTAAIIAVINEIDNWLKEILR